MTTIHLDSCTSLDYDSWLESKALEFNARFKSEGIYFTSACIQNFVDCCNGVREPDHDWTDDEKLCMEEICQCLNTSREIQDALDQAEQGIQPIEEPEGQEGAVEAQEPVLLPGGSSDDLEKPKPVSPLQDAYDKANAANQKAKQRPATVVSPKKIGSLERAIVDAAMESRLDNAYSGLREVFDFGPDLTSVKLKEGIQPSPVEFGKLLGMGNDMGRKSLWLVGEAANFLMVGGHEESLSVIADNFGFSYSHASNLARVVQRVSPEQRIGLLPSVAVEIAAAKYSDNPKENQEIIDAAIERAKEEKWNCQQARSESRLLRNIDDPITEGKEKPKDKIARLERALGDILKIEIGPRSDADWESFEEARSIARKALGIIEPLAMAS